jgi:hypothetical protein
VKNYTEYSVSNVCKVSSTRLRAFFEEESVGTYVGNGRIVSHAT